MRPYILSQDEIIFLKKLCRPDPFAPTSFEVAILGIFRKEGIVKTFKDGSVEVTDRGAECYAATLEMNG
jgi:hypothetical protein